jgi:hypothetical protein
VPTSSSSPKTATPVASALFRGVHRGIGFADEILVGFAWIPRGRDAEAGRDGDLPATDRKGCAQRVHQAPRKLHCVPGVAEPLGEHEKLVAAESGDEVGGTYGSTETSGDRHEQLVAGFVAEGVVHLLEVVHVDEDDSDVEIPRRRPGARRRQPVEEVLPVRQPRQRVVNRAMNELCFGSFPAVDVLDHRG